MADRTRGGRAVIVAGVAAQLSVATVGAMPWAALPLSAAAYVVAGELSQRAKGGRADALRWAGTSLAVLGLVVFGSRLVGTGDRTEIKQALGLMLITAQIGQAMSWRVLRDVRSGLMASFGLLVLASSYAPDVLIGIPVLVGWVAIILGLALLGGLGRLEATRAAAVAVVLGLVGFLLIPVEPTQGARNRLNALAAGSTGNRLPADPLSTGDLDLRRRGSLSTAGVLRIPRGAPSLWRATSFDGYDGRGWSRDVQRGRLPGDGPTFTVASTDGTLRTDAVQRVGPAVTDGTLWSPGRIVSVTAPGPASALANDRGDLELYPSPTYEVTSESPVTDRALLTSSRGADAPEALRYLGLPASLPPRVGALAQQLDTRASRYETAEAIAAYLRGHMTYRLDSPVPLPGEDAVDRFLFVDKTGFCEQFASAEVVLLRSLSIPARLVTGLAYGVPDGDATLMRISDLHAWVELWVPGVGWVSSDPTAGAQLADAGVAGFRRRLAADLSRALKQLTLVPGGRPALAGGLLVLGLLASALLTRRPAGRASKRQDQQTHSPGPALSAFLRLDQRLGTRRRRAAESLRELGGRLDPAVAQALVVVERECYGPRQPEPAEVRAAVAVLDRASAPDPEAHRARRGRLAGRGRTPRRG